MLKALVPFGKIALFFIGEFFSIWTFADFWYVGPIFGAVVLAWNARSLREIMSVGNAAFLLASTLIYALVRLLEARLSGDFGLYVPVAVGTILLPLAHKLFLGASWWRVATAIPGIYILWHVLILLFDNLDYKGLMYALINLVSIWQALYLAFFFWPSRHFVSSEGKTQ